MTPTKLTLPSGRIVFANPDVMERLLERDKQDTADKRAYETRRDALLELASERARITWPNGAQRSGLVSSRKIGDETLACLDGSTLMGEICPAVRIERLVSGRYRPHWSADHEHCAEIGCCWSHRDPCEVGRV